MKITLFDIENQLDKDLVQEAYDIIRLTREFDITNPEKGKYHIISKQPDFHVEVALKENGLANARCNCTVYKKQGVCKHVTASLLLLRDHLKGDRKTYKKQNKEILNDVLQKISMAELKTFISSYAMSHAALRSDIFSNYLYLTKRPDYHHLFLDLAPIDKFGQIRINRNNIKTIRSVSSTLLKRAQLLLLEKSLAEAFSILEAVITHVHRLHNKLPQFQDQLMVELKHAYRLFESLCQQPMAPRLQQRVITLALDICERDAYTFPAGMKPLIQMTENFLLEDKIRKEAMGIAEKKVQMRGGQSLKWASLLYHWMRIWDMYPGKRLLSQMESMLPDITREFASQNEYEDVLYTMAHIDNNKVQPAVSHVTLQAGLKSAKALGDKDKLVSFAYELALHHLDMNGWQELFEIDKERAVHALRVIEEIYQPGADPKADELLLNGFKLSGNGLALLERLKSIGDVNLLAGYDRGLKEKYREGLENLYVYLIYIIRDTYGGVAAKQRLNTIFSHLKEIDLYQGIMEKIKRMEEKKDLPESPPQIKGFVFDLDGVIVDTAAHHFQSWKKILKQLGADITEEDDHHTRGAGRMESLDYLLDKYQIKLPQEEKLEWAAKKNDVYLEAIQSITPADLLPGALPFIEEARRMGLLIALGSASKNAAVVLEKLGVAYQFHAIVDGNHTKASKPDPEIFLKASAALGLAPSNVVVFEDAPKGVEAALRAGCKVVGIGDASNLGSAHLIMSGLDKLSPEQIIEQLT